MPQPFVARRPPPVDSTAGAASHGLALRVAVPAAAPPGSAGDAPRGPDRDVPDAFGPLGPLVADPAVTDVFVTGDGRVWLDRGRGCERSGVAALTGSQARELAVRLLSLGGRHVDEATPCADARVGDGIRVHAVLPPIAPHGALLSVRLPSQERWSMDRLDEAGFFPGGVRSRLEALVRDRSNLLITGGGGTGKTTLLAALLSTAPPQERIVLIEDVGELRVDHPHAVALQARQANLEGAGAVGLERLVREALRMRPDRLVLGECRGGEVRELLAALNTGHEGGAGTLHANSLHDVPARLEALGALAGMEPVALARQAVSAVHAVVHLGRSEAGRLVQRIGRLELDDRGRLRVSGEHER